MAHRMRIGGTNYAVTGGRILVGATGYDVVLGRTKIDGTHYDVGVGDLYTVTFFGNPSYLGPYDASNRRVQASFNAWINNYQVSWPGTRMAIPGSLLYINSISKVVDAGGGIVDEGPQMKIYVNGNYYGSSLNINLTGNTMVAVINAYQVAVSI